MSIRRFILLTLATSFAFDSKALAQIPAFPGAEGFGAHAAGGDVYIVTNLNEAGAGSFSDAVTTAPVAGRTVVFAVRPPHSPTPLPVLTVPGAAGTKAIS